MPVYSSNGTPVERDALQDGVNALAPAEALVELKRLFREQFAPYPQYVAYSDGWKLGRTTKNVRRRGGGIALFLKGDYVLYGPEPGYVDSVEGFSLRCGWNAVIGAKAVKAVLPVEVATG